MSAGATASRMDQEGWSSRKRRLQLPGGSVAFVELDGAGPALVLVHGFTDTSRSFSLLLPHLGPRRVVLPDLRGHGSSTGAQPAVLSDYACDLLALLDALDLERPILVGHSLGSMVAMEACLRRPSAAGGLVLLAGTPQPGIDADHPLAVGIAALRDPIMPDDPFYNYWHQCGPGVPRQFLDQIAKEASDMPARTWRSTLDMIRGIDLRQRAHALASMPALIINGAEDPLFGPDHRDMLTAALPQAAVVDLEGCGHNPHWEKPASVATAIARHFPPQRVF